MGIISCIGSAISGVVHAVGSVCSKIGGGIMRAIGGGIGAAVRTVSGILAPGPGIVFRAVGIIARIASSIAEILVGKPKEEEPEELGMKAEIAYDEEGITPEDFSSVDRYIKHIRENIELDKEKLKNLNEEERATYKAIGTGLYAKSIEENYGVILEPEFYRAAYRINLDAETATRLIEAMGNNGIKHAKCFEDYLLDKLIPGSSECYDMNMAVKEVFETAEAIDSLRQSYAKYIDQ